ncbi:SH3 domain-containing protein [Fictibacillus sp. Mic-4]|uniref:SH3 domain-containing protein n=1 Tax=Fictibacillus sp. Mic-4 TaxID=3132826 RepID=UPI003CED20CC
MKSKIRLPACFIVLALFFSTIQPAVFAAGTNTGTVNATSLNVRSSASTTAKVIGSLKNGTKVTILAEKNGWGQISYKGKKGWISLKYIKKSSSSSSQLASKLKKGTVTASSLNVRTSYRTTASKIGALKKGEKVTILAEKSGWGQISYKGKKGWISLKYIQLESSKPIKESNPNTSSAAKPKPAMVTASSLNFRSGPGTAYKLIGTLKKGTVINVLKQQGSWSNVKTSSAQLGWVSTKYLTFKVDTTNPKPGKPDKPSKPESKIVTIKADTLNLRTGPGTSYSTIGYAYYGDVLEYVETSDNGWVKVKLANGKTAWVSGKYVLVTEGTVPKPNPGENPGPLAGKRIVIDPGHGGHDSGAIGTKYGTHEADLTLSTAKIVADKLRREGATVILTRTDDTYITLQGRVDISHRYFSDAFVSIHFNSADSTATGIETLYYYSKNTSLANDIQTNVIKETGMRNRGIKFQNVHVLRENSRPAVLVELGFLTNPQEEFLIRTSSYQNKAAEGIICGLEDYFQ